MGSKFEGKVAVVTASTDGIGLAIARRLGQDGASVMISSRKQANVDRTVQQLKEENINAHGIVCHVAKSEDRKKLIDEAVSRFGGIDILVSNAAANPSFGPMLETSESAWDKIFETNVKATFFLCQEAVPHIESRGGGSIVIVSSIGGFVPFASIGAYSVSKTTLFGIVKGLTSELAARNIRINSIAPGVIKTKFSQALTDNEDATNEALKHIPANRFGRPEDCSGLVSFLASNDADYITGENIVVSGGMTSRL